MDSTAYVAITRQDGLKRALAAIANNVANASTAGYRRQEVIFTEHVEAAPDGGRSISMAKAAVERTDLGQGPLRPTGGAFDFAIEGDGFFMVETPAGDRLTRAGSFTPNAAGELVSPDGYRLLDAGGAPVLVPPDGGQVSLAPDGTLSAADRPIAQVGLYAPVDPKDLVREGSALFRVEGPVDAGEAGRFMQGFVEDANVDPILEIARMIEVQHAYNAGKTLIEREDERVRGVLRTLGP